MSAQIRENLAALVGRESWQRGLRLFREHAVLDLHRRSRSVEARVANEHGGFERVRLTVRNRQITARCSCGAPLEFCPHAVAGLLRISDELPAYIGFLDAASPPRSTAAAGAAAPGAGAAGSVRSGARRAPPPPSLAALLDGAAPEARLRLSLCGPPVTMESRWSKAMIDARLSFGGRSYSAGNIKRLVESGNAAGGMRLACFSLQEQQALRFLVVNAEAVGTSFRLNSYDMADFFHCLSGFGAFESGAGRLHIHPERLELSLSVAGDADSATVMPGILLAGRGRMPAGKVSYITGRGGYWVGMGCDYWWLPGVIPPVWLRVFLKGRPLRLSAAGRQRLEALCAAGRFPARLVPAGKTRDLAVRPGGCKPVLLLEWEKHSIRAALEFEYAGKRIGPESPDILWGRNRFISRDDQAEKQAVSRLQAMGFSGPARGRGWFRLEQADGMWQFVNRHLAKLCSSWRVYWSPEFSEKRAASGTVSLTVRAARETPSWFEAFFDLTSGDGSRVLWEDIAKAVLKDREFACLRSGAVVQMPHALLTVLRELASRALSRDGSTFRFGLYSILPMSDAVLPYWQGARPAWQRLAARLRSPGDYPPVHLPERIHARLREYQKEGIAWLKLLEACGFHGILADEMGLGKTVEALGVIASRRAHGQATQPSLVVCPTSLLENWLVEAHRFVPEVRTVVIRGADREAQIRDLRTSDLGITSYALLRRDIAVYAELEFDYVILDEAQHIKNPLTANARTCKELCAEHRLILTGTPIENSLAEIWSLFDFLLPGLLGSRQYFRDEYELVGPNGQCRRSTTDLAAQIRPFILRRTKSEVCRQLPPKIEQVVYCEMGERQLQVYRSLLRSGRELLARAQAEGWQRRRFDVLSILLRLRQVCCHVDLLPPEVREQYPGRIESVKTELAQEMILEAIDSGHRILFFSQFTALLKILRAWLDAGGIRYEYLDGSTRGRQQRVDHFNNDGSIPLFLLSLRAGGTGLNLTGADTVLHYDQWWNPMVEDQATDRTHRIGQSRPVTALKLVVRHTIEEKVLALQAGKRQLFQQLLDGVPGKLGDLTPEDVEFLLE